MIEHVVELLNQKGYRLFDKQTSGVYVREADDKVYAVMLSVYQSNISISQYEQLRSRTEFKVANLFGKKVQTLYIFFTKNGMFEQELLDLANGLSGAWFLAMDTRRIYIFENQPSQFDNLHDYLEKGLADKLSAESFQFTPVNTVIVAANILYFVLIIVWYGGYGVIYDKDAMLLVGALSYNTFFQGAWYQIVTSLFLHFGIGHLFNNMVLLIYAGCELERRIGKLSFLFLYFVSGIGGNVLSLLYYHAMGEDMIISAGASGAIFGVLGALALYLIQSKTETTNLTARRLVILAGLTIYSGITSTGVDNAAHIGGLICGLTGEFLLSKILQYGKLE